MKAKMFLLIVVFLAAFVLQGCNGPDGGGREAPYSTSPGPAEGPAEGPLSQQVVVQPPVQERREGPVPGT